MRRKKRRKAKEKKKVRRLENKEKEEKGEEEEERKERKENEVKRKYKERFLCDIKTTIDEWINQRTDFKHTIFLTCSAAAFGTFSPYLENEIVPQHL